jgi:predicted DNA-binding transcriptional regulator AlpA
MTGIKPRTIERWRLLGQGPQFQKVGGKLVRYRISAIELWLQQHGGNPEALQKAA